MQLCFDATKFGVGLREAVEMAAARHIPSVEFAFEPFETSTKTLKLSEQETQYLADVRAYCEETGTQVACIRLNVFLDCTDKKAVKSFQLMMRKLSVVAETLGCSRISFWLKPASEDAWVKEAADAINPVLRDLDKRAQKLLLSLSTPPHLQGMTLRHWRPMQPQEWRDLIVNCEGLGLSFSAADCAWQNIDYLQILPHLVAAIEHVEANDVEINRTLLKDSGLFGPLWWRYRQPGKGQVDWGQLIEALKLYDYKGSLSIKLDDEFLDAANGGLEDSLDESVKMLAPLLKG